ncbi:MAG: Gfo/Idh/MocA family oxidoreductase [Candidatus Kapabacteria bacterium]|nr:Gfo/Idh/MocA family oxidoreductase [Candidatus Kapabacteria bacterium]MDW8012241.1 Gfo/Idh/MocA family oxidoreductase [Bacteroidota bacterium]
MIRLTILGVGHMGSLHLQKWRQHPEVEVVGIYDSDPQRLHESAAAFGVRAFEDWREALAVADAVTIATPSWTHGGLALEALRAGCHCLVEKPLATRAADAEQLLEAAYRKGLVLMAGHIERYNPAFVWLQSQGAKPRFVEGHRLHPFRPRAVDVSVVFDIMIHDIDLLLALLHSPVERLEAHGVAVVTEKADIANARLVFSNGCIANLTASRISAKFLRKMRLFQPYSYVALDFAEQSVEQVILHVGEYMPSEPEELLAEWVPHDGVRRCIIRHRLQLAAGDPLWEEQRAFLQALQGRADWQQGLEQAVEAVRIAERIEQMIACSS